MFSERAALQQLFMALDTARERRYEQHLNEMAEIDKKLSVLLNELRRMDEEKRVHDLELQEQRIRAQVITKERLATMEQSIVPKRPERSEPVPRTPEPVVKPVPNPIPRSPEPVKQPEPPKQEIGKPRFEDGKKIYPDGAINYQCYYVCPKCEHKGKRFIPQSAIETWCHNCGRSMKVEHATEKGFPHADEFNNHFVAGKFVRTDSKSILPPNPVDDILAKYEAERQAAAAAEEGPIAAALKKAVKS